MEISCIIGIIVASVTVLGFLGSIIKYMIIDPNNKSNKELQETIKELQDLIKDFRREFQIDLEKTNQRVQNHEIRIAVLEDHDKSWVIYWITSNQNI